MTTFIYDIPNWVLALIITSIVSLTAMLCVIIGSFFPNSITNKKNNSIIVTVLNNQISVAYGIILGFVAVSVWGTYDKASLLVEQEAKSARDIWIYVEPYPEKTRKEVREAVVNYVKILIDEEWALQQIGSLSLNAKQAILKLNKLIIAYEPQTEAQKILQGVVIHSFSDLQDARSIRAFTFNKGTDSVIWYPIIFGTLVILLFGASLHCESLSFHLIISGLLGVGIGLVIFMIVAFDYPFRGQVSITSDSFKTILGDFERIEKEEQSSSDPTSK